jgi:uncharacterized protein (DUF305 family)
VTAHTDSTIRPHSLALFAATLLAAGAAPADSPIVQPGAPGEASRELTADEAVAIANSSYSPADVQFMQDMIPHHHQALEMAALVADRTNRQELIDVAGRINASQNDEIEFMQEWLAERGEQVPEPTAHDAMHMSHEMAGMATPEQMAELAASQGSDFDRLFLQLMITHHEGAVTMVEELLEQPGAAYDPVLFEFTNEVTNSQSTEIERMNVLLVGLSDDPRAGLAAGYENASQAVSNMELVTSLAKPAGFFNPNNPSGLPPTRFQEETEEADDEGGDEAGDGADPDVTGAPTETFSSLPHTTTTTFAAGKVWHCQLAYRNPHDLQSPVLEVQKVRTDDSLNPPLPFSSHPAACCGAGGRPARASWATCWGSISMTGPPIVNLN